MTSTKFHLTMILGVIIACLRFEVWENYQPGWLVSLHGAQCEEPKYDARIVSFDPLIIHLENFVTKRERQQIIAYASPKLEPSFLVGNNGTRSVSTFRTSSSALVPRNFSAASCILKRFTSFQGFVPINDVENLQLTSYQEGQQFKPHMDWGTNETNRDSERWRRATTGFAILEADCDNCGTQFPRIKTNWTDTSHDWCRILDCAADVLTVQPLPGSLLFWQNTRSDGLVDQRMLHAGLPAVGGTKTGLNIWSKIDLWQTRVGLTASSDDA